MAELVRLFPEMIDVAENRPKKTSPPRRKGPLRALGAFAVKAFEDTNMAAPEKLDLRSHDAAGAFLRLFHAETRRGGGAEGKKFSNSP